MVVFHWRLSDSKSPQVFMIFVSYLVLAVLWFGRSWFFLWSPVHPVSFSGSRFLGTVPSNPTTIDITVTTLHNFTSSLARSRHFMIFIRLFRNFSYQRYLMVFHWRLSDCKSPQVSKFLTILADLSNVV